MSYKSRPGGWKVECCISDCIHNGTEVCKQCVAKSHYEAPKKDENT
jgi:hypothetical protein